MELDPEVCYRALRTRDARFDGRFFTAVRSTGIYCRPVCPAPTPKRENCTFLPCAAAAREAGYRPCLRCRPEAAPGTPAWRGTSATVARALRLIDEGALDEGGVSQLATRLGIGERHLRRLFLAHLGAPPQAVAHTRRIAFAKRLLDETALPMTRVAFAAGFSSVRRFNSALREAYGRTPRELRGNARARDAGQAIALRLSYRPPFDWRALLDFLAPRAIPGVEQVDTERYRRTLRIGDAQGVVAVHDAPEAGQLVAEIRLEADAPLLGAAEALRRLFDLSADPDAIAEQLGRDPSLRKHLRRARGIRVPGAFDGFELAVRIILGQQVSVPGASQLTGRLAATYGEALRLEGADAALSHVFPAPDRLIEADARKLRIPEARARAIRALAEAVAAGTLRLAPGGDPEETRTRLLALPGIGPWTADVIAMRVLAEPDAFPAGDLGIRKALAAGDEPLAEDAALARSQRWRPWRSYAAMLLWKSLSEAHRPRTS